MARAKAMGRYGWKTVGRGRALRQGWRCTKRRATSGGLHVRGPSSSQRCRSAEEVIGRDLERRTDDIRMTPKPLAYRMHADMQMAEWKSLRHPCGTL